MLLFFIAPWINSWFPFALFRFVVVCILLIGSTSFRFVAYCLILCLPVMLLKFNAVCFLFFCVAICILLFVLWLYFAGLNGLCLHKELILICNF